MLLQRVRAILRAGAFALGEAEGQQSRWNQRPLLLGDGEGSCALEPPSTSSQGSGLWQRRCRPHSEMGFQLYLLTEPQLRKE